MIGPIWMTPIHHLVSLSFFPLPFFTLSIMYTPPSPHSKIIIVGGGTFGLSTAYALSQKNQYDIWVFDRQEIPSPDAASTGNCCVA